MMIKSDLYKKLFGLLALCFLMLPSLTQLEHLTKDHEHVQCSDSSLHFHESETTCDLFDFKLNPVAEFAFVKADTPELFFFKKPKFESPFLIYQTPHLSFQLRGPPQLS
ncbi:MAG: hypothetical protein ACKVJM_07895 [Flavobacteriales bacterium]|jgi:hypothetical protein|nr:hypothetical protein [Flavobacteriaceae bacterium]MDO7702892.1 hypothetical protein [Flavobacteriaceae bacterium]|tara:strand:- start:2274 stop:2600 length:327 start_codon:yes stop_codon:yes gene_type:complete